jgi:hypothetical protein
VCLILSATLLSHIERREENNKFLPLLKITRLKNQKLQVKVKKCAAPLTLYSSNGQAIPERDLKMRGQLLWCLRISLRIAESPYKQLRNFANSRHCLRRMRYRKEKKKAREREKCRFCLLGFGEHGRFSRGAAVAEIS